MQQIKGTFLVALSGILYGSLGFLGTKLVSSHFSIENMLFWRFFIATVWMGFAMLLFNKKPVMQTLKQISFAKILVLGAILYSGSSGFYFIASRYIGTGLAMVIFYCFPVFVAMLAWILDGWRINRYALAALIAVVFGLLLLQGQGPHTLNLAGIGFGIIAALSYALYVYASRHYSKTIDTRLLTLLVCLGTMLIFLVLSCYTKSFSLPPTAKAWLYVCAIGIIATAIPIQLMLDGLKYISSVKASILSVSEPVITVLLGLLLLNETISTMQAWGVIILLSGALFIQFERSLQH